MLKKQSAAMLSSTVLSGAPCQPVTVFLGFFVFLLVLYFFFVDVFFVDLDFDYEDDDDDDE